MLRRASAAPALCVPTVLRKAAAAARRRRLGLAVKANLKVKLGASVAPSGSASQGARGPSQLLTLPHLAQGNCDYDNWRWSKWVYDSEKTALQPGLHFKFDPETSSVKETEVDEVRSVLVAGALVSRARERTFLSRVSAGHLAPGTV